MVPRCSSPGVPSDIFPSRGRVGVYGMNVCTGLVYGGGVYGGGGGKAGGVLRVGFNLNPCSDGDERHSLGFNGCTAPTGLTTAGCHVRSVPWGEENDAETLAVEDRSNAPLELSFSFNSRLMLSWEVRISGSSESTSFTLVTFDEEPRDCLFEFFLLL